MRRIVLMMAADTVCGVCGKKFGEHTIEELAACAASRN